MKIPPSLIQAFVHFCESDTIESAAKAIGITQPALSKQLKNLESHLPYKLFSYKGKKKVLTPFGKSLYDDLSEKFHSLERSIVTTCNRYGEPKNSSIRIAARAEVIERIASSLNFEGKVNFFELGHEQIVNEILKGQIDIGITHSAPDSNEVVAKKLFKETFNILVPKSKKRSINYNSYPAISYKENDPVLRSTCLALGLNFSNLNIKRTCSNYMLVRDMVESGIGWAVIPSHLKYDTSKCKVVDLKKMKSVQKEFFISYRKENSQVAWHKELLLLIQKCF